MTSIARLGPVFIALLLVGVLVRPTPAGAAPLAPTPPMGWNDWAHYQCNYTAKAILANAKALVSTGLAARGYDAVTVDDCWMSRHRNAAGDLQPNPKRFPQGMAPVVAAVHALGLKFGIYEDAGSETCGGFAGSGEPKGGGKSHFVQDAKLFAKWGVDYLKLDGCNVYVPKGSSPVAAYRKAYAAESAALKASGRPIVFLESAPAYFQGKPAWYDVLSWVGQYGQLWREGSDIKTFDSAHPSAPRFHSVLWNYAYNLPLGRYQKPGNWNDPDFIIGGDGGMSLAETRSQLALWAMMSAPLVLSVNVAKLSRAAIHILGNKAVIRVDQDPLGNMATLVQRTPASDVLLKALSGGDYAVAVLNRSRTPISIDLPLDRFGFFTGETCTLSVRNLWTNTASTHQKSLKAKVKPHDTIVWRLHPASGCTKPTRSGAIVMTVPGSWHVPRSRDVENYGRCLADTGAVQRCQGDTSELWTVSADGTLRAGKQCLTVVKGAPKMQPCSNKPAQQWTYRQNGNLVNNGDHLCLGVEGAKDKPRPWRMQPCRHNLSTQIWALPN